MAQDKQLRRYTVRHSDGSRSGPLNAAALRSLAAEGTIGRDDQIQQVGKDEWHRAEGVPGLIFPEVPRRSRERTTIARYWRSPGTILLLVILAIVIGILIGKEHAGPIQQSEPPPSEAALPESIERVVESEPDASSVPQNATPGPAAIAERAADPVAKFKDIYECIAAKADAHSINNSDRDEDGLLSATVVANGGVLVFAEWDVRRTNSVRQNLKGIISGLWDGGGFGVYEVHLEYRWDGSAWTETGFRTSLHVDTFGRGNLSQDLANRSVRTLYQSQKMNECH